MNKSPDAMASVLQLAHALQTHLEEALGEARLSGPKFMALSKLVEAGEPLALSLLAAQCACVRSNITQLVDRLEAEKLVRRVSDPDDRRSLRAAITPLGRQRHAAGARKVGEVRRKLGKALAAVDHEALQRALAEMSK
jgi:DNA-binding MarR family transcriptional regulator